MKEREYSPHINLHKNMNRVTPLLSATSPVIFVITVCLKPLSVHLQKDTEDFKHFLGNVWLRNTMIHAELYSAG